jgi:hypothetical protein
MVNNTTLWSLYCLTVNSPSNGISYYNADGWRTLREPIRVADGLLHFGSDYLCSVCGILLLLQGFGGIAQVRQFKKPSITLNFQTRQLQGINYYSKGQASSGQNRRRTHFRSLSSIIY